MKTKCTPTVANRKPQDRAARFVHVISIEYPDASYHVDIATYSSEPPITWVLSCVSRMLRLAQSHGRILPVLRSGLDDLPSDTRAHLQMRNFMSVVTYKRKMHWMLQIGAKHGDYTFTGHASAISALPSGSILNFYKVV